MPTGEGWAAYTWNTEKSLNFGTALSAARVSGDAHSARDGWFFVKIASLKVAYEPPDTNVPKPASTRATMVRRPVIELVVNPAG